MNNTLNTTSEAPRTASRIETQTETLKALVNRIELITNRNIEHARQLGFFEPPKDGGSSAVSPVVGTLDDALRSLERAVDHLDGSMNLFN